MNFFVMEAGVSVLLLRKARIAHPTMVELSKGTMNGPQAVATGRMKAAGNMEKMFHLGKAMDLLPVIEAGIGLDY